MDKKSEITQYLNKICYAENYMLSEGKKLTKIFKLTMDLDNTVRTKFILYEMGSNMLG